MDNETKYGMNRRLLNLMEPVLTDRITVTYRDAHGIRTYTDNAIGVAAYILPTDEIVSVTRAV